MTVKRSMNEDDELEDFNHREITLEGVAKIRLVSVLIVSILQ